MPQQFVILILFLVVAVLLGAGFVISAVQARRGPDDYDGIHDTGHRLRRYWFVFLIVVVVGALGATLPHMPYPMVQKPAAGTEVTTVEVEGYQFGWGLENEVGDTWDINPNNTDQVHDQPAVARVGDHVRFRVTSLDVNHGFLIENGQGNIIGQVQAMPGVTNSLYFRFDRPGVYTIRCGELCGIGHTDMHGVIRIEE